MTMSINSFESNDPAEITPSNDNCRDTSQYFFRKPGYQGVSRLPKLTNFSAVVLAFILSH
jgi:hypothetical protein